MDGISAPFAWSYPLAQMIHKQSNETREKTLEQEYRAAAFTPMAAADRPGTYLTPHFWSAHYPSPYGVSNPHGAPSHSVIKRPSGSCDCTNCATASSPPLTVYKPFYMAQEDRRNEPPTAQMFAGRDSHPSRAMPPNEPLQQTVSSSLRVSEKETLDGMASGPRRGRTVFTAQQLQVLERVFSSTQYIVGSQRKFLAGQLRLSETQVRVWFQNRRIKWRKQMLTHSSLNA